MAAASTGAAHRVPVPSRFRRTLKVQTSAPPAGHHGRIQHVFQTGADLQCHCHSAPLLRTSGHMAGTQLGAREVYGGCGALRSKGPQRLQQQCQTGADRHPRDPLTRVSGSPASLPAARHRWRHHGRLAPSNPAVRHRLSQVLALAAR